MVDERLSKEKGFTMFFKKIWKSSGQMFNLFMTEHNSWYQYRNIEVVGSSFLNFPMISI